MTSALRQQWRARWDHLRTIPSTFEHHQRCYDGQHFRDPRIAHITESILPMRRMRAPRLWEFAVAVDVLESAGYLRDDVAALGLGCGREPLLYAMANTVGDLTITDLYTPDTVWSTEARTNDPTPFVTTNPIFPTDFSRSTVRSMDMRDLTMPDASVDLVWSISSLEHIGTREDFVRHFQEVARVLRPGGAYLMTTELHLGESTFAVPHNMAFSMADLESYFRDGGLQPEPIFDCRLTDRAANDPRDERDVWGTLWGGLTSYEVVRNFCGVISIQVVFLLKHQNGAYRPMDVLGLDDTIEQARRRRAEVIARRRGRWMRPHPYASLPGSVTDRCFAHRRSQAAPPTEAGQDGGVLFGTKYVPLGTGRCEIQWSLLVGPHKAGESVRFLVNAWRAGEPSDITCVMTHDVVLPGGDSQGLVYQTTIDTDDDFTYSVLAMTASPKLAYHAADVQYRML